MYAFSRSRVPSRFTSIQSPTPPVLPLRRGHHSSPRSNLRLLPAALPLPPLCAEQSPWRPPLSPSEFPLERPPQLRNQPQLCLTPPRLSDMAPDAASHFPRRCTSPSLPESSNPLRAAELPPVAGCRR